VKLTQRNKKEEGKYDSRTIARSINWNSIHKRRIRPTILGSLPEHQGERKRSCQSIYPLLSKQSCSVESCEGIDFRSTFVGVAVLGSIDSVQKAKNASFHAECVAEIRTESVFVLGIDTILRKRNASCYKNRKESNYSERRFSWVHRYSNRMDDLRWRYHRLHAIE